MFNNLHLKQKKTINTYTNSITCISNFPSGNFVLVSSNNIIQIYDIEYKIIQTIKEAHDKGINYVNIKDENNFVTCSRDNTIKTWIKINDKEHKNKYILNKIINNAHKENGIYTVIYDLNNHLISCSKDKTIKIWEEINKNEYQNNVILTHSDSIKSILLLKDKNILISSGYDGTKFWNINNYECLIYMKELICCWWNSLKRIDKDRIIIGNENGPSKIISISEKKIIKEIETVSCYSICIINNKGIFVIGGYNIINIYKSDNYDNIQTILYNHNGCIYGINELKNGDLISYGRNGKIKIWTF